MFDFIARWIENRKPCQFCGEVIRDGKRRRVVVKRTYWDFYKSKGRYRFHEKCLREALESSDFKTVDLALSIIKCVRYEAGNKRKKEEWRQMRLDEAKEASAELDSDLQGLYG